MKATSRDRARRGFPRKTRSAQATAERAMFKTWDVLHQKAKKKEVTCYQTGDVTSGIPELVSDKKVSQWLQDPVV